MHLFFNASSSEEAKVDFAVQTLRNTAVLALFGYILYRAVEPVIKKQLNKSDSKKPVEPKKPAEPKPAKATFD